MLSLCLRVWLRNHGNMQWRQTLSVLPQYQQTVSLSTSRPLDAKVKMTRMLEKMMNKGKKRKWTGLTASFMADDQGIGGQRKSKITDGQRRRAVQVGKVLYDYIASIMNSGELHAELVDCSVQVSKVVVAADFSAVNVFWLASGTKADVETQKLLDNNSGKLRSMLISLRVIGRVPQINFVKDMSEARFEQIEELLKLADMGPEEDRQEEEPVVTISNPTMHQVTRSTQSRLKADFERLSEFSNSTGVWLESEGAHRQNLPLGVDRTSGSDDTNQKLMAKMLDSNRNSSIENDRLEHLDGLKKQHPLKGSANFRTDIYGLKQDDLVSKILMLKRKAKDRNLNLVINDEGKDAEIPSIPTALGGDKAHKTVNRRPKQKAVYTLVDAVKDDERWLKEEDSFEGFEYLQEDYFSHDDRRDE